MERRNDLIRKFYRSNEWKLARALKIAATDGLCEKCGKVGEEVHHIKHLTQDNVSDPEVSINQENLILLCKDCHNEIHGRFSKATKFDKDGNYVG